jgi:hypothetical protein
VFEHGEKNRLSSDSSDKPFIFNKSVIWGCRWLNTSRPGRGFFG